MQIQLIQNKIYEVRGLKVMLDFDLAELYEVETRALNQAVKRNIKRFPVDFMFQLTQKEWDNMLSQNVMTYPSKRPKTATPLAFTEQGLAMLSGLLNSDKAIDVNIAIMRAFVMLRQYHMNYNELKIEIERLEKEMNYKFKDIYEALNHLLEPPKQERKLIGFIKDKDK